MGNPPLTLDKPPTNAQKVMWAAVTLALSNIGALLKQVKDILEAITEIESFIPKQVPFWVIGGAIGIAVLAGNLILFRYLFEKLKTRLLPGRTVIAATISALVIGIIIIVNFLAIPELRADPSLARTRLLAELSGAQQPGDPAGFLVYANKQDTKDDAWTTAQALKAILSVSDKLEDKERLKSAFRYLERKRLPDGWNADPYGTQPFIRTEISSWVALAYLESLRKAEFWGPQESSDAVSKTIILLSSIARMQNPRTGAWAPVVEPDTKFDRTYPTLMAVWALSEAMKAQDLSRDFKASIGGSLNRGISWLIETYRTGYGWDENPQLHVSRRFNGLTFETLLVLKGAEDIQAHNSFKESQAYKAIKLDIINLATQPFAVNDTFAIPTGDQNVNGKQCWANFAAYPWSLAALSILSKDRDIPSSDRRKLNRIKQKEIQELSQLPSYLQDCETWEVAENLIGLGVMLRENAKK